MAADAVGVPHDSTGARSGQSAALSLSLDAGWLPARGDVYLPPELPDRVPAIHRQEVLIGQGKQAKVLRKTELQRLHTRHPERDRVICTRFCTSSSERT